jgi:hypothetical protein
MGIDASAEAVTSRYVILGSRATILGTRATAHPAARCDILHSTRHDAVPPLFSVTTDRVRLTWSGPPAPADATAQSGRLTVRALRAGAELRVEVAGEQAASEAPLRLAEQTAYRLFVTSRTGEPVTLRHRDPALTRGLAHEDEGRVVAGAVDFGGQIGRSGLVVAVGGVEEVRVEVDVFPTKVTAADVETMRADVDEALAGLAFEYLRATATPFAQGMGPLRRATWLTLLHRTLPALEAALDRIAARPHRELEREAELVRAEHVRRPDAALRRAVRQRRGAGGAQRLRSGVPVRARLPERLARATLDTAEHRWLRARLDAARHTLADLHTEESLRPPTARRRRVLADLTDAEHRLGRLLRLTPLAEASPGPPPTPTPRLLAAPAYAEAYAACRALDLSLTVADGPVPHATKDLWALYEMWCYLTVVRRVAAHLDRPVPAPAFFRAEHRGVRFLLRRGRRHAVTLRRGDLRATVTYNPRFASRSALLAQRPDLLLTVKRRGAVRRFVLDAKYRRDDSARYVRRYGAPGPPEEALGDLHRYRDAIVEAAGGRSVEEAVALYPYCPTEAEAFTGRRLWTSIQRIGVGAIPLVPGAADWLDRWLQRVLGE